MEEDTKARSRGWCFTVFLKDDDVDVDVRKNVIELHKLKNCVYIIVGIETCPTTGRKHLQGYVYYKNAVSFKSVKTVLRESHWEKAKGTPEQNQKYCSKEGNYVEEGECPKKGKRKDLEEARSLAKAGTSDLVILETCGYQASRHAMLMKARGAGPIRNWKPEVWWICGSTGSGKTKTAWEMFPNAWFSMKDLKNWEGYDGQEDVIVDDFRRDFCTFHELLRILDRYPYRVNYKFGSGQLLAKNIVITTPYCIKHTYDTRCTEDVLQLVRRVDHQLGDCERCKTIDTLVGGNTRAPTNDEGLFETLMGVRNV